VETIKLSSLCSIPQLLKQFRQSPGMQKGWPRLTTAAFTKVQDGSGHAAWDGWRPPQCSDHATDNCCSKGNKKKQQEGQATSINTWIDGAIRSSVC